MQKQRIKGCKLSILEVGGTPLSLLILKTDFYIGRSKECAVQVSCDAISRKQCHVFIKNDDLVIQELETANKSFLNGKEIPSQKIFALKEGFKVSFPTAKVEIIIEQILREDLESNIEKNIEISRATVKVSPKHTKSTNVETLVKKLELEQTLKTLNIKIEEQKQKYHIAKQEFAVFESLKENEKKEVEKKLLDLLKQTAHSEEKCKQLKQDTLRAEAELESLASNQDHLLKSLSDTTNRKDESDKELQSIQETIEKLKEQKLQIQAEMESYSKEIPIWESRLMSKKQKVSKIQLNLEHKQNEFSEFVLQAAKESAHFEDLLERVKLRCRAEETEKLLTVSRLQTQIEEKKSETLRHDHQLKELQTLIESKSNELSALNTQSQKEQNDYKTTIEKFVEQKLTLEKEIQQTQQVFEEQKKHLALECKRSEAMNAELHLATENLKKHLKELAQSKVQNENEVRLKKEEFQREAEQLRASHLKFQADWEIQKAAMEAEKQKHLDEIKTLSVNFEVWKNKESMRQQSEFENWKSHEIQKLTREYQEKHEVNEKNFREECSLKLKSQLNEQEEELKQRRQRFEAEIRLKKVGVEKELKHLKDTTHQTFVEQIKERNEFLLQGLELALRQAAKDHQHTLPTELVESSDLKFRALFDQIILSPSVEMLKTLKANPSLWIDRKLRKPWLDRNARSLALVSCSLFVIFLGLFVFHPQRGIKSWAESQEKIAQSHFNEELLKQRQAAARFFDPPKDKIYRQSFFENLLYLEGYRIAKLSEDYKKAYILKVQDFFSKEIPGGDRRGPKYLASEATLLNLLEEESRKISLKNPESGIERLRLIEAAFQDRLFEAAGTPKQLEKIKRLDEELFKNWTTKESFRSPANSQSE